MSAWYLTIKSVHVWSVFLSVALFVLRGGLMLADSRLLQSPLFRVIPHVIDAVLLTSALMLTTIIHQYPFVHGWLTVKVLAVVAYIVLGSIAIRRGRSKPIRIAALLAALTVVGFIYSVARAHHPLGALLSLTS